MLSKTEPALISDVRPGGVVILGGAHGTLALARSLGALGVPVYLVSSDTPLPGFSRHVRGRFDWPGPDDPEAAHFLNELAAKQGWTGFLLVPGGDGEVRMASQSLDTLSAAYSVTLPAWNTLQLACEKPQLYRHALTLGLDVPRTYDFQSIDEAAAADIRFPVVIKPNMGGGKGRLAKLKVIRAEDRAGFLADLREAAADIGLGNVVVQELIPGGGENQFSYAGLWQQGAPVAEFTARRTRQYPIDFGYTSTFVEVVDEPKVADAARRLLLSIGHHGLVEIEFKRDPRDGALKLLDVNPRPWSWLGLAAAAGIDLGAMLWDASHGRMVAPLVAHAETSWMYLVRDVVVAAKLIGSGRLKASDYVRSFASVKAWATFAGRDPVPGLIDIPLTAWRVLTRRVLGLF